MKPLTEFTLFPLLPAELRLHIWGEACHERVVEVLYQAEDDKVVTTTNPPTPLHVCRESREIALKIYRKSFHTQSHVGEMYFCPWRDTLYLPRHRDMGYDESTRDFRTYVSDTEDVSSLAIDHVRPDIIRPWEPYNKLWLIQSFPHLKEVFLVIGSDPHNCLENHTEIELIDPIGDPCAVLRILEHVKESFEYEAHSCMKCDGREDILIPCPFKAKSKVTRELPSNTNMITCI